MMLNPNRGHSGGDHCSHWVGDRNAPCPGQLPLTGHTPITNLKAKINPIFMDWGHKVSMWGHFWPSQFGGTCMCWRCTMTLILNTVSIISPFIIITNTSSSSYESSHQLCWNLSPSCLMMCLILLNCLIKQCWETMWEWGNAERQVARFENEKNICWQTSLNLDVSARRKESWEQLFIKSTAALKLMETMNALNPLLNLFSQSEDKLSRSAKTLKWPENTTSPLSGSSQPEVSESPTVQIYCISDLTFPRELSDLDLLKSNRLFMMEFPSLTVTKTL